MSHRPGTGGYRDRTARRNGRHSINGFSWLLEQEYARVPIPRPWVFSGSRRRADGVLGADLSGEGLALVDKPDCLLALSRSHADRNSELWVAANTPAIPDLHTPVQIIIRPAAPRSYQVCVDRRGSRFCGWIFYAGRGSGGSDRVGATLDDGLRASDRIETDAPRGYQTITEDVANGRASANGGRVYQAADALGHSCWTFLHMLQRQTSMPDVCLPMNPRSTAALVAREKAKTL